MQPDVTSVLAAVSESVMTAIKDIAGRQKDSPKPIGVDTISLVLGVPIIDLGPIIKYLEATGKILVHENPNAKQGKANRPYSISLPHATME